MKKHFLCILMLIFIVFPITAQKSKDLLMLKNGNMIFGKLIEVSDSLYKIRTADGSLYFYRASEVNRIELADSFFEGRKKNGGGFTIEAGIMAGAQSSQYKAPFSCNFLISVTKNTRNVFSAGSGVEYLGQPFMPLFVEYKVLFSDNKTTPFIFIRGGKLFHLNGDFGGSDATGQQYNVPTSYKGGGSFTIGTGISWVRDWGETYLSFAYRNLHISYDETGYNLLTSTYKNSYNRLEIKYGFRF
jgi:hypothetical protein